MTGRVLKHRSAGPENAPGTTLSRARGGRRLARRLGLGLTRRPRRPPILAPHRLERDRDPDAHPRVRARADVELGLAVRDPLAHAEAAHAGEAAGAAAAPYPEPDG